MESLARNIERIRNDKNGPNYGDAFSGAAVLVDVNTGEVLTMVSYPSYPAEVFLAGSEDKEAQQTIIDLNKDENKLKALLNRAIQENYAPGSTFKPLTAVAALEKGVITPTSNNRVDKGTLFIGGRSLFCLKGGLREWCAQFAESSRDIMQVYFIRSEQKQNRSIDQLGE
jgi:penicillin-binding protein 2